MMKLIAIFGLLIVAATVTNGTNTCESGGSTVCAQQGLSCCYHHHANTYQCYNPSTAVCLNAITDQGQPTTVLCGDQHPGIHDDVCGIHCYDVVNYVCCNRQLYICSQPNPCNKQCPHTCSGNGNYACNQQGLSCCNHYHAGTFQCYNPQTAFCSPGIDPVTGGSVTVLCGDQQPNVHDYACNVTCYDPVSYLCCNGKIHGCGEPNPCGKTCSTSSASTSTTKSATTGSTSTSTSTSTGSTSTTGSAPTTGSASTTGSVSTTTGTKVCHPIVLPLRITEFNLLCGNITISFINCKVVIKVQLAVGFTLTNAIRFYLDDNSAPWSITQFGSTMQVNGLTTFTFERSFSAFNLLCNGKLYFALQARILIGAALIAKPAWAVGTIGFGAGLGTYSVFDVCCTSICG